MIDLLLSLAFSIQSNRGVYALLLGSGVSRPAGVPTGWEIILDLTRKLAHVVGENCEPHPEEWYKRKFGEEPNYSKLIEGIAKTASERSGLLRSYFEPTEEEIQQKIKVPSQGHGAIAELVKLGFIRVIVTTNFDRLLEKALQDVGITPTVIHTPDAAEGALPLSHLGCCVIKVHGDYKDRRIKNSPEELSNFDPRIERLLDRVFDEYGLVVCGWSAQWDTALRGALERSKSHRFSTFWLFHSHLADEAKSLISLRCAQVLQIKDATSFFLELKDKVVSLDEFSVAHPLSPKVAAATLKRYICDERLATRVHDLVMGETEKFRTELDERNFPRHGNQGELASRVHHYEELCSTLLHLFIVGGYWGAREYETLWTRSIEAIANTLGKPSLVGAKWNLLRRYPALLLCYGVGIASIAAGRYGTLVAVLKRAQIKIGVQNYPLACAMNGSVILQSINAQFIFNTAESAPLSKHLHDLLRDPLREFLPSENSYDKCFDRFEYLLALVQLDLCMTGDVQLGRFAFRNYPRGESPSEQVRIESGPNGAGWIPLQVGLFNAYGRFETLAESLQLQIQKIRA